MEQELADTSHIDPKIVRILTENFRDMMNRWIDINKKLPELREEHTSFTFQCRNACGKLVSVEMKDKKSFYSYCKNNLITHWKPDYANLYY